MGVQSRNFISCPFPLARSRRPTLESSRKYCCCHRTILTTLAAAAAEEEKNFLQWSLDWYLYLLYRTTIHAAIGSLRGIYIYVPGPRSKTVYSDSSVNYLIPIIIISATVDKEEFFLYHAASLPPPPAFFWPGVCWRVIGICDPFRFLQCSTSSQDQRIVFADCDGFFLCVKVCVCVVLRKLIKIWTIAAPSFLFLWCSGLVGYLSSSSSTSSSECKKDQHLRTYTLPRIN